MGTIKMKNQNVETAKIPLADTAMQAAEPIEHPTWDDPAVLREDATFTDEHSRLYYLNNGTAKSVISATSVNYYDEQSKSWQRIDNTLVERDGVLQNNRGGFKAEISKDGGRQSVKVGKKQRQVSWTYLGKQEGETAVAALRAKTPAKRADCTVKNEQNRAVFENVERQTDLEYSVHGDALKENIIVKEKSDSYRYMFALQTQGLAMRLSDDNNAIELYDETTQEAAFTIPAPYMYDADGVRSDDVYYELEPSGDAYTFAVIAAADWINAENRAMPVTIDPQIETSTSNLLSISMQRREVTMTAYGPNYGEWMPTTLYQNIKVGYDGQFEYVTDLTVMRSKMRILKNRITSAKLLLTPTKSQDGYFYLNNRLKHYSGGLPITVNIKSQLDAGGDDFVLRFDPDSESPDVEFYMTGEHAPVLEVEYLINENLKPCTRTFDLVGNATAVVDVPTGEVDVQIPAASGEGLSLPYNIYQVYKRSGEDFGCGKNLRLNLHEKLKKENTGALTANYVYTDTFGNKHGLNESFYYLDVNNNKVTVYRSSIKVDVDGTLSDADGNKVFKEERSDTGWEAITKLESVTNVEFFEQRQDEIKQLEEQVQAYENTLKEYVVMDTATDKIAVDDNRAITLEDLSMENYKRFMAKLSYSQYMPITRNEMFSYQSMRLQNKGYHIQDAARKDQKAYNSTQKDAIGHQQQAITLSRQSIGYQIDSIEDELRGIDVESYTKEQERSAAVKTNLISQRSNLGDQSRDLDKQVTYMDKQEKSSDDLWDNQTQQNDLIYAQANAVRAKRKLYTTQLEQYYKEYVNKKAELALRKKLAPVHYLTDGEIVKCFNEEGELVAICDCYENVIAIERDKNDRISRVYDDRERAIVFAYNTQGKLTSITDALGRRTEYGYDENDPDRLQTITYADGNTLTLTGAAQLSKITSKYDETSFSYSGTQLRALLYDNLFTSVQHGKQIGNRTQVSSIAFTYDNSQTHITDSENETVEMYEFDANDNVSKYYVQSHGVVTKAEQYSYTKYVKDEIEYAKPDTLNLSPLSSFTFTVGEYSRTELDAFNAPVKCVAGGKQIDVGINQSAETEYFYDDDRRVIKEYATIAITGQPVKHAVKTYVYNRQGKATRTESYIEEEIVDGGKNVEETVYDQKGRPIKTFTYNTLDTSSKFYTESELDENGKTTAELDQTGENKTKLEYIDGTENVRAQTLPNGSKFAYGHDQSGRVTAITQSTQAGEENSTQIAYTGELATEVKSGNNTVRYAYDGKGRKTAVDLNDTKEYVKIAYAEKTTEDGKTVNKATASYVRRDASLPQDVFETVTDMRGNTVKTKYNGETQVAYTYDERNRLAELNDKVSGNYAWGYDSFDRVTNYSGGNVSESYAYNTDGNVATKTVTAGGVNTIYEYVYKDNVAKDLDYMKLGNIASSPQSDCLGRNTGKEIYIANKKVASESISYRKVGDHATNMPSAERYGEMRNGKFVLLDNRKYKYDACGNISEVWEDGTLAARYAYDKLNRLIREDNKLLGKTTLFTYDNNGNILSKRAFAFTLKDTTLLEELTETQSVLYAYDGDRLLSFGDETCTYDGMGNPTVYRGNSCAWEKGRQLISYNGVTFAYDGQGRRTSKTANGVTANFTYDSNGNLIKQTDGANTLEFLYDHSGVMGVKFGGNTYIYRRNAQGDIIAILDSSGNIVVKYNYDAWGNHEVKILDGTAENNKATHIGNLNPFRYRGYYYDTETELYYLKTRYYDPAVGRFTTIDDLSYLDPETINGLNLYAYCVNNPVMNVDPTGEFAILSFLLALGIAALVGAAVGVVGTFASDVVCSIFTGEWRFSSWETYLGNAIGGAVGGMLSLIPGVGAFVGSVVGGTLGAFTGLAIGKATGSNSMSWEEIGLHTAISFGISLVTAGLTQYIKIPGVTQGSHSWQQVFKSGFTKILRYGSSMSAKTLLKGVGYLAVSSFTAGFLASNILQGFISAQLYLWNKKKAGYGSIYMTQG